MCEDILYAKFHEIFSMGAKMDKNIFIDEIDDASKFTT